MTPLLPRRAVLAAALAAALVGSAAMPANAGVGARPVGATTTPAFLGQATLPTGLVFEGTPVGGLSGTAPGTPASGIRNNVAFESAGLTPQGQFLFTATENALAQDGPAATLTTTSPSRILRFDARTGRLGKEFVYEVEKVADAPVPATASPPTAWSSCCRWGRPGCSPWSGASRSVWATPRGSTSSSSPARPTSVGAAGCPRTCPACARLTRRCCSTSGTLGVPLDDLEALAFGPPPPDGRRSLVVTSDDNFSASQTTQFLAFAL